MTEAEDPRARFRHMPEAVVSREDLVETVETQTPPVAETEHDAASRSLRLAGGGTP
jgi:hypothetical protein